MRYDLGGLEITSVFNDGLNSPNFIRLLSELTDLAAFAEHNPKLAQFDYVPFSQSQRDRIRNRINELMENHAQVSRAMSDLSVAIAKTNDPLEKANLRSQFEILQGECDFPFRIVSNEVAPLLDQTQRRQLRDVGIGVVLSNNSIEDIFNGARDHFGLIVTPEQRALIVQGFKREAAELLWDRAKRTHEGWNRFVKELPAGTDKELERFFGLDLLDDDSP